VGRIIAALVLPWIALGIAATEQASASISICFSPMEPCDERIVKWLDTATVSIDLAAYDFTLDALAHHLLVKARTIPVRVIADRRQAHGSHSLLPMLIRASNDPKLKLKLSVRFGKQRGIMHHKFTILDHRRLETGSFNYTNNASRNNQENQVYLDEAETVKRFSEHFDRMWKAAKTATLRTE